MATVKLPLLDGDISTRDLMRAFAKHRVPGAVVRSGATFGLVMLDDVLPKFDRDKPVLFADIESVILPHRDLDVIEGKMVRVLVDGSLASRLAAPIYVCPRGDESSTSPGVCSYHLVPLKRV